MNTGKTSAADYQVYQVITAESIPKFLQNSNYYCTTDGMLNQTHTYDISVSYTYGSTCPSTLSTTPTTQRLAHT